MLFKNVSRLCQERGITICALERELNIGNGTIGKWELRGQKPRLETVQKIATFFGVTLEYLLADSQHRMRGEGVTNE